MVVGMNTIFGHSWEAIQRAQQGGRLHETVDTSRPLDHSASQADIGLLELHGQDGLAKLGYAGTLDRLHRSGILP